MNLVELAGRDDLGALSMLQGCSAGATIQVGLGGATVLTTTSQWNMTSITRSNVGIYTFVFNPFDFTGTTYPLQVHVTIGNVAASGAAGLKLFATYTVVDNKTVKVFTWLHDGTATELTYTAGPPVVYDTLSVLVVGRRSRKTSDGTNDIDPRKSFKTIAYDLGVTGL